MILMSNRITLYSNLRNIFFILCIAFVVISIFYGIRVHIISIIQKHFGFERKREIARRMAGGYAEPSTTARMRKQKNSGRMSGHLNTNYIDVSQVKTEKIPKSKRLQESAARQEEGTVVLGAKETTLLGAEETTLLGAEETTLLGAEETTLLGAEETTLLGQDTVVLDTSGAETTVLGLTQPASGAEQDTVVLSPEQRMQVKKKVDIMVVHGEDII